MKLKLLLLAIGIILLSWGTWGVWEAVAFLKRSQIVQASVNSYSGIRTLEREIGDCTAYSKGCSASVSYTLEDGTSVTTEVAQPQFARTKLDKITLAVDPQDPRNPRIASVHIIFRNPMVGIAFGLVLTLIPGVLLRARPVHNS